MRQFGLTAAQISASLREARSDCADKFSGAQLLACRRGVDLAEKNMKDRSPFLSGVAGKKRKR